MVAFKNHSTRSNVLSVFFVAVSKSRSVYIGPWSMIHLSGPYQNIPNEFHVYLSPQMKSGCTSTRRRGYQGIGFSNALLCGCKNCAGYWLLFLVNPLNLSTWTRMDAERDKREARKNIYILKGTLQLFFGSWCTERLKKKNLARHYFQIGVIICPKTDTE